MGLRHLPSVDRLVRSHEGALPRSLLVEVVRAALDETRQRMAREEEVDAETLVGAAIEEVVSLRPHEVVNATGVLLHTNLGRSPLHPKAAEAASAAATGYGNLEVDLQTGERGRRAAYLERLLCSLTGAEAALALNNNAGGLLLALAALAGSRGVAVSRGELIEIGGSYRLPELMAASGALMVEVGTTNRTRASDYRGAGDVAVILKVHPSNYRISGFTEEAGLEELKAVSSQRGIPLVFDAGSGLLDERVPWLGGPPPSWLRGEPGVRQSLERGADLVLFSGDKLLGGPQAGIVVGEASLVARLRRHPMARALRLDGPTLAALGVTLELYAEGRAAELPFWAMASATEESLRRRCEQVLEQAGVVGEVRTGSSTPGAGSVPGSELPSPVIVLRGHTDGRWRALLHQDPPVLARREGGELVVDLRAVFAGQDEHVARALAVACRS